MVANKNEYVPFAVGQGANTTTPAAYAALPAVQTGFQAGYARSLHMNTALRQLSVVITALAQLTADYGSGDVLDDGNVSKLENQILVALRNAVAVTPAPGIPYEGVDSGSTANAVYVQTTNPISGPLAAGQVFLIEKSSSGNTGTMTFKNGSNDPVSVVYPDGTPLLGAEWSARATALLYVVSRSGSLVAQFMGPSSRSVTAALAVAIPAPIALVDASGQVTVPPGAGHVYARLWGGGGGGGGSGGGNTVANGGGGGEYREAILNVTPGMNMNAVVGSGGGGFPGPSVGTGSPGGDSSFGGVVAKAGGGGTGSGQLSSANGGRNGTGGTGFPGFDGESGFINGTTGVVALGGGASFGSSHGHFNSTPANTASTGVPGLYPGQGGGGGMCGGGGGTGSNGRIILQWLP